MDSGRGVPGRPLLSAVRPASPIRGCHSMNVVVGKRTSGRWIFADRVRTKVRAERMVFFELLESDFGSGTPGLRLIRQDRLRLDAPAEALPLKNVVGQGMPQHFQKGLGQAANMESSQSKLLFDPTEG